MIPPSGEFPSSHLRGRVVDYGIEITYTTGLKTSDMTLFASNIFAHSVDRETYIEEITLDSLEIMYGSSSHRMLGSAAAPLNTKLQAKGKRISGTGSMARYLSSIVPSMGVMVKH